MDRRAFLTRTGAVALFGGVALETPAREFTSVGRIFTRERSLNLFRPATREHLSLAYLDDDPSALDAYLRISWLLRDVRTNQQVRIDPLLIDILEWTQRYLAGFGYTAPLHILSGYRSFTTNSRTEGASRNSMHLYGKAVDFKVPDLSAAYLGRLMAWLSQGGVGVDIRRGFVHIDTGTVRQWSVMSRKRRPRRKK